MRITRAVYTILLLGGLCGGCFIQSPECERFFELPRERRDKEFLSYSIEKQVRIYHCGMEWHPAHDYSYEIAAGGGKNIPFLLEQLRTEHSELRKADVIGIFRVMAVLGHLNGKEEVVKELESNVAEMRSTLTKEKAQVHLEVIKEKTKIRF